MDKTNRTNVRPATLEDYEAVCKLSRQCDTHHAKLLPEVFQTFSGPSRPRQWLARFVQEDNADVLVAEVGDKIVGLLILRKAAHPSYPMFRPHEYAYIEDLVVDADYRRQGVGGVLLEAAKKWALDRGLFFLQTTVWVANQDARHFYQRQGFVPLTERLEFRIGE